MHLKLKTMTKRANSMSSEQKMVITNSWWKRLHAQVSSRTENHIVLLLRIISTRSTRLVGKRMKRKNKKNTRKTKCKGSFLWIQLRIRWPQSMMKWSKKRNNPWMEERNGTKSNHRPPTHLRTLIRVILKPSQSYTTTFECWGGPTPSRWRPCRRTQPVTNSWQPNSTLIFKLSWVSSRLI